MMSGFIFRPWHYISELGVWAEETQEGKLLVRWYNRMSFLSALFSIPVIVVSYILEVHPVYRVVIWFLCLLYVCTLLLNSIGWVTSARYLIAICSPIWGNGLKLLVGGYIGIGLVTVSSIAVVLVAFRKKVFVMWSLIGYLLLFYFFTVIYVIEVGPIYTLVEFKYDEIAVFAGAVSWTLVMLITYDHDLTLLLNNVANKNQELKQTNIELDRYTIIVTNDLRAPLRTVASYVEKAEHGVESNNQKLVEDCLGHIKSAAKQMNYLIMNVLELGATEAHHDNKVEPIDLNQICRKAQQNLELVINNSHAKIHLDRLPGILANETDFIVLFQNIIKNAIVHNNKIRPRLEVYIRHLGAESCIVFRDNGVGIPKHSFREIFEFSQRIENGLPYGGSGAGLWLCNKIIMRYGGRIEVDSAIGVGSTFTIVVPSAMILNKDKRNRIDRVSAVLG